MSIELTPAGAEGVRSIRQVHVTVDAETFAPIDNALTTKYGPPSTTVHGALLTQTWRQGDMTLHAIKSPRSAHLVLYRTSDA